jgi:hypothetical protein
VTLRFLNPVPQAERDNPATALRCSSQGRAAGRMPGREAGAAAGPRCHLNGDIHVSTRVVCGSSMPVEQYDSGLPVPHLAVILTVMAAVLQTSCRIYIFPAQHAC